MEVKHNGRSLLHEKDEAYMDWLEAQTGRYQTKCRDAFLMFMDFLREEGFEDPTGDRILAQHLENQRSDEEKVKHYFADLVPKFHEWLKTEYRSPKTGKPLTHNSATSYVAPLRGFFSFHRASLELTPAQQSKIAMIEVRKKYHAFKHDELSKMARVADLEEKAVILLGICEGVRVGDFVSQPRRPIIEAYKDRGGEFPLEFEVETEKAGVLAVCHITEECWQALQDYWANVPDSVYVFPSNGRHISADRANDVLKNTWLRAYPDRPDVKIRFHELRSYKMSALTNAQTNDWHVKRMVGKKLPQDIMTYLEGIDLSKDFMRAQEAFTFLGLAPSNHVVVGQLAQAYDDLEEKVGGMEEIIKALTKENVELREKLRESNEEVTSELEEAKERLAESVNLMKDLGMGLSEMIQQFYLAASGKMDIEMGTIPMEKWQKDIEKLIKKLNE